MKNFWQNLPAIKRRFGTSKTLFVFLDFDGTLAPIVSSPGEAVLPIATRKLVERLSKKPGIEVAVVSGRPLEDVKKRMGSADIAYAGDHGWEWEIGGKIYRKSINQHIRRTLDQAVTVANFLAARYPGVAVEQKYASVAIHYRAIGKEKERAFLVDLTRYVGPIFASGCLVWTRGKKVRELCPGVAWGKGDMVRTLMMKFKKTLPGPYALVYIGDDRTDEDVFAAYPTAVTIHVGNARRTKASYFVKNTLEVQKVLEWFVDYAGCDIVKETDE